MTENKSKKKINYYKFSTFILGGIILIFLVVFFYNLHTESKFNDGVRYGQDLLIENLVGEISSKGYVSLILGENQTLVLVPSSSIEKSREQIIMYLLDTVRTKGYVGLYDNQSEIILVPYHDHEE